MAAMYETGGIHRLVLHGICSVLLLILLLDVHGVAGAYRGGYSRSYRSYSSYRYYSYSSYNTYRSQTIRYTRTYYGSSAYMYYYGMYYYHYYGSSGYYLNRDSGGSGSSVCENYEANQNGSYLGSFSCPLPFEPTDFTSCCGNSYAEYCCKPSKTGMIVGIVIGSLLLIGIIALIAVCVTKNKKSSKARATVNPARTHVATTASSGQPPPYRMAQSGYPMQAVRSYPAPGPYSQGRRPYGPPLQGPPPYGPRPTDPPPQNWQAPPPQGPPTQGSRPQGPTTQGPPPQVPPTQGPSPPSYQPYPLPASGTAPVPPTSAMYDNPGADGPPPEQAPPPYQPS